MKLLLAHALALLVFASAAYGSPRSSIGDGSNWGEINIRTKGNGTTVNVPSSHPPILIPIYLAPAGDLRKGKRKRKRKGGKR